MVLHVVITIPTLLTSKSYRSAEQRALQIVHHVKREVPGNLRDIYLWLLAILD